jgi:hypothetical protein
LKVSRGKGQARRVKKQVSRDRGFTVSRVKNTGLAACETAADRKIGAKPQFFTAA